MLAIITALRMRHIHQIFIALVEVALCETKRHWNDGVFVEFYVSTIPLLELSITLFMNCMRCWRGRREGQKTAESSKTILGLHSEKERWGKTDS